MRPSCSEMGAVRRCGYGPNSVLREVMWRCVEIQGAGQAPGGRDRWVLGGIARVGGKDPGGPGDRYLDRSAVRAVYGRPRADLERQGTPMAAMERLIVSLRSGGRAPTADQVTAGGRVRAM